jgi:DNA adenine methylase
MEETHNPATPFLKWAGGKRALLGELLPRFPMFDGTFIEPFLGAGAVFFAVDPDLAKIGNDFNGDLIEVYDVVRDDVEALIRELRRHVNDEDSFKKIRALDQTAGFSRLSPVTRAARFIYLNKTCFNGLYRVNSKGHFNVPFGHHKNPDFVMADNLRLVSEFLRTPSKSGELPRLMAGDYKGATSLASTGDFVYLDPPYDPVSTSSSFVQYQKGGFGREEQERLRNEILRLTELGVPAMMSNSDTQFIRSLFADADVFKVETVSVRRSIGASASSRGKIGEVIITNSLAVNWGK